MRYFIEIKPIESRYSEFNFKNIRTLLIEGFTDGELRRLCYDEPDFRPVYDQLSQGMGKDQVIDKLIEYTERRELINRLLTLTKVHNLRKYERHQPYNNLPSGPTVSSSLHGKTQRAYTGSIHQGNPTIAKSLPALKLSPDDEVTIKEQTYSLGELVQALIKFNRTDLEIAFEERGQLEIGHYLYQQIFGDIHSSDLKPSPDDQVDLRIVTDDEHIASLPWVLLAHQGLFLTAAGWSVSLARTSQRRVCHLPASPKMLVVAPEPVNVEKTKAKTHLEMLEYRLSLYDHHLSVGDNIRVAATWDEYRRLLPEFTPHIVYYYGHGEGDQYQSRLVFATGNQKQRIDKPIADFAQCLHELAEPPSLVYLNCCSGNAGGFLGAGWQLGAFIPAVITNRTVTYIDAAQAQALALWQSILLDGRPPHVAMTEMRSKLADLNLSFQDARWMTPVIHCDYSEWNSTPPQRIDPLVHDPHWHLKLDRVAQFGTTAFQTRQMLREYRPRTLAYVWYGQKGQGIDLFHKRLRIELQDDLDTQAHFYEVRPEWPMDYAEPNRSFADMLTEAFDVHALQDIPRSIRSYTRGAVGRQTLVYVRHQPVKSKHTLNPRLLKAYLTWWDQVFAPLLQERCYALLTISFEVNNPIKFRQALLDGEKLYDLDLGSVPRLP